MSLLDKIAGGVEPGSNPMDIDQRRASCRHSCVTNYLNIGLFGYLVWSILIRRRHSGSPKPDFFFYPFFSTPMSFNVKSVAFVAAAFCSAMTSRFSMY